MLRHTHIACLCSSVVCWQQSSFNRAGIATTLQAGRFGVWTLVVARKFIFSTPVQTGPNTHPASRTISTVAFFPGVKTHFHLAPRLRITTYIQLIPVWAFRVLWGDLYFYLNLSIKPTYASTSNSVSQMYLKNHKIYDLWKADGCGSNDDSYTGVDFGIIA